MFIYFVVIGVMGYIFCYIFFYLKYIDNNVLLLYVCMLLYISFRFIIWNKWGFVRLDFEGYLFGNWYCY